MEIDFREAIELMKAGKEEGFNKLYSATYNKVYFRAKQCTKTETDAQDVTQITFIEAYKNINKLEAPEATLSWLYTIVYNQSCKMYRNEREKREFLLSEETEGVFDIVESSDIETMPELSADQKATAEIIRGIIEELPELQKMTVLAFYFDNLKLEQIAETMDCSVNTVKSRLNYARKYIKDRVESEEKKGGYKLHAFALPTLLWAIKLMLEETSLTAYAAESIYAGSCGALGLKASTLALAGAGTGTASSATSAGTAASATAAKTAATTGVKMGTAKALMIAGAVAVAGAGTFGGVYMYQHSQSAIVEEVQLEDGTGVTEDVLLEYDDNTVDLANIDLSEFITLSNNSGTGAVKHPEKISEYEYLFRASDFDDLTDEYVSISIAEYKLPDGVWCESVTSGDYVDEITPPWAGMSFSRAEGGKWDYILKFTDREYVPKDLPYSSENGIDFQRLIGEWSAPDGTKLWIATTDGSTEGASVEFIKEHDIGWSDAELIRNEGNVALFEYPGGGTIEIDDVDLENIHIIYYMENEFGSWSDSVDYIMTSPGYEYYVH